MYLQLLQRTKVQRTPTGPSYLVLARCIGSFLFAAAEFGPCKDVREQLTRADAMRHATDAERFELLCELGDVQRKTMEYAAAAESYDNAEKNIPRTHGQR